MLAGPCPLAPDAGPRVHPSFGWCALDSGDQCVGVCSTCQRLPLVLEQVELLRNCSPPSDDLEVELTEVLVKERDRDVFRTHIRWVARSRNFPER